MFINVKKIKILMEENNFLEKEKKRRISIWMISTIVIVLLLIISIFTNGFSIGGITGATTKDVEESVKNYIEENLVEPGTIIEIKNIEKENGMYKMTLNIQGQEFDSYVSEDGKLLFPSVIDMTEEIPNSPSQTQTVTEVPKQNKPKVELFVMSFCPYGTQAEKGILPVVALLGNKIDFKLRFVHYILHGDKEDIENKRELCIREEQGQDKLNKYLVCILDSDNVQEPKDINECEKESGIDSGKLKTCMDKKADNYFESDSVLSKNYGVQGSPTLIINGVQSNAGRSPASYLSGICDAFTTVPKECDEQLSSSSPSAGFGYNEGTDTVAQC